MFGVAADISLRILAAAAAVGLVLVVLRVRSGAARHAAWSAVLLAMLTMPLLTTIVPTVEVAVPSTLALDLGTIAGPDDGVGAAAHWREGQASREFTRAQPPAPVDPDLSTNRSLSARPAMDWWGVATVLYALG